MAIDQAGDNVAADADSEDEQEPKGQLISKGPYKKSVSSKIHYCLDLRKPDLRNNLDLRKIVATTHF